MRASRAASLLAVAALAAGGCSGAPSRDPSPPPSSPDGAATGSPVPAAPPGPARRLGLVEGWGPSADDLDQAARLVGRLPLPSLAGQVIVVEWRGTRPPVALVRDLHLGGVIAFADNVVSTHQVRAVNTRLTRAVRRRWPLFLAVDQEGGVVERVRDDATRFPAFMSTGAARDADLTQAAYAASGAELRGLGFTVDLAPDADVTIGPGDPTIGSRSASSDPGTVARQAVAAARGFAESGVVPVLKHFPGHGSVRADSHRTLPVQTRTRAQLEARDLVPFAAAVEAGLPAVMVGHLDVRAVHPRVPSSLSRRVVTGLLRDDLGFEGLVVTDSLGMAAVTRTHGSARSAVAAVRAGADVVLMPPSPVQARAALVRAVRSGALPRRRLEQAAARQVALLLATDHGRGRPPGSGRAASRALSAGAVTLVQGPCEGRLVEGSVHPYGDAVAVARFATAATRAGLEVLLRRQPPARLADARPEPRRRDGETRRHYRERRRSWARAEQRRERRLAAWTAREDARLAPATAVALVGYGDPPLEGEVVVATDTPYVLGRVAAPVRVATYGDTPGAMDVLVEVLLGRAPAPGRLPVPVAGVARRGC